MPYDGSFPSDEIEICYGKLYSHRYDNAVKICMVIDNVNKFFPQTLLQNIRHLAIITCPH